MTGSNLVACTTDSSACFARIGLIRQKPPVVEPRHSDGGTVSPEYIGRHVVDARIGLINQDKRGCGDDTANM